MDMAAMLPESRLRQSAARQPARSPTVRPSRFVVFQRLMQRKASSARVVVVGGGFAGLWAVRALADAAVDITLIDGCNHHLFQPLLYQVAMAGLAAPSIAAPLRHILRRQRNVTVQLGTVTAIDKEAGAVVADGTRYPYDYLIVATGVAQLRDRRRRGDRCRARRACARFSSARALCGSFPAIRSRTSSAASTRAPRRCCWSRPARASCRRS